MFSCKEINLKCLSYPRQLPPGTHWAAQVWAWEKARGAGVCMPRAEGQECSLRWVSEEPHQLQNGSRAGSQGEAGPVCRHCAKHPRVSALTVYSRHISRSAGKGLRKNKPNHICTLSLLSFPAQSTYWSLNLCLQPALFYKNDS